MLSYVAKTQIEMIQFIYFALKNAFGLSIR